MFSQGVAQTHGSTERASIHLSGFGTAISEGFRTCKFCWYRLSCRDEHFLVGPSRMLSNFFFCPEDTKNWIEGKITGAVYHGGKESHPKMFDMLSWFKLGKFHTDLKQPLAPPKTNPW